MLAQTEPCTSTAGDGKHRRGVGRQQPTPKTLSPTAQNLPPSDQHATHPEAGLSAGLVQSPFQGCKAGAPVPEKLPLQLLHISDASLLQSSHGGRRHALGQRKGVLIRVARLHSAMLLSCSSIHISDKSGGLLPDALPAQLALQLLPVLDASLLWSNCNKWHAQGPGSPHQGCSTV